MGAALKKIVDEAYDINKHIHLRIELYENLIGANKTKTKVSDGVE